MGMKPIDSDQEPNQGEGDKVSARDYNRRVRDFVEEGRVDEAARSAAKFVEAEPDEAARDERAAKRGPHGALSGTKVSIDELVAKGRNVIDRVRPVVERVVERVKAKLSK
jgi:hypothetical protein